MLIFVLYRISERNADLITSMSSFSSSCAHHDGHFSTNLVIDNTRGSQEPFCRSPFSNGLPERARPFCGLLWEICCTKTHLVHVTGFTLRCIVSPVFLVVRTRPSPKNGWNWPFPFSHRVLAHNTFLRAIEEPHDTPSEHSPHCYMVAYQRHRLHSRKKLKWPSFLTLLFYAS